MLRVRADRRPSPLRLSLRSALSVLVIVVVAALPTQVAFALAFFSTLKGEEGFHTIWQSMVTLFVMSMGEIDMPFSDNM